MGDPDYTQPLPGILEAHSIQKTYWNLVGSAITGAIACLRDMDDWPAPSLVAMQAHKYAAAAVTHAPHAANELRRQERLAEIGELAIGFYSQIDLHDTAMHTAIEAYLNDFMRSPTEPAPPPDGPMVGASRNADAEEETLP